MTWSIVTELNKRQWHQRPLYCPTPHCVGSVERRAGTFRVVVDWPVKVSFSTLSLYREALIIS